MNNVKEYIFDIAKNDENVVAIYLYGSRVYEVNSEDSDFDFILVQKDKEDFSLKYKLENYKIDFLSFSQEEFKNKINEHEISVLECLWLSDFNKIEKVKFKDDFVLNKGILRNSVSAKSSNSWVKAKKKLIVDKDYAPYVGKKSLWHSIRMLDFGTQIAKDGYISNYKSCNDLYFEIMETKDSWDDLNLRFKGLYNQKATEFKSVAPKDLQNNKIKF